MIRLTTWTAGVVGCLATASGCGMSPAPAQTDEELSPSATTIDGDSVATSTSATVAVVSDMTTAVAEVTSDTTVVAVETTAADVACVYPEGAADPMAVGEVLVPYAWPEAIDKEGNRVKLDLNEVYCNTSEDVDWSVHQILVFISLPAW